MLGEHSCLPVPSQPREASLANDGETRGPDMRPSAWLRKAQQMESGRRSSCSRSLCRLTDRRSQQTHLVPCSVELVDKVDAPHRLRATPPTAGSAQLHRELRLRVSYAESTQQVTVEERVLRRPCNERYTVLLILPASVHRKPGTRHLTWRISFQLPLETFLGTGQRFNGTGEFLSRHYRS